MDAKITKRSEIRFFIREEPYGFLSNFYRLPFVAWSDNGVFLYPTNEHYYQAQKANCLEVHEWIRGAPHARLAMVMGGQLEHNKYLKDKYMKKDWDQQRPGVMLRGLRAKFENIYMRKMLLETGYAILIENNPEDFFWGIGDGTGKSWLGKLQMIVREECRGWACNDLGRCTCKAVETCPVGGICAEIKEAGLNVA